MSLGKIKILKRSKCISSEAKKRKYWGFILKKKKKKKKKKSKDICRNLYNLP